MTGYYSIHTQVQEELEPLDHLGLDLGFKLLPKYFKDLAYTTYAVGE